MRHCDLLIEKAAFLTLCPCVLKAFDEAVIVDGRVEREWHR